MSERLEIEARKQALAHAVHLATILPPNQEQKTAAEVVTDAECYLAFLMSPEGSTDQPERRDKDPGQAGKAQGQQLLRLLGGYDVKAEPQTGDKTTRAMPLASQAAGGNVKILEADWTFEPDDDWQAAPPGTKLN